ncbi:GntR family transcriptional regulator [Streptomyces sp. MAR4 CNX-425]|uniref:GntR family transcriptional regulator n=1 Tax=Streptomyces sp. MAR4 CNX-425 TaxID=3406343 RepID=UPI003B501BCD
MLIRIDPGSGVPLSEQVAASVRRALAAGSLRPGDRLPPAREVAGALGINVHTVLRGYGQLREQRLIDLRRGRGAVVIATPAQTRLHEAVDQLVAAARESGLSEEGAVALVRASWGSPMTAESPSPSAAPGYEAAAPADEG